MKGQCIFLQHGSCILTTPVHCPLKTGKSATQFVYIFCLLLLSTNQLIAYISQLSVIFVDFYLVCLHFVFTFTEFVCLLLLSLFTFTEFVYFSQ